MTFIGKQTSYISIQINQRIQRRTLNVPTESVRSVESSVTYPRNDTLSYEESFSLSLPSSPPLVICSLPIKRTFRPNRKAIRAIRCSDSMEFDPASDARMDHYFCAVFIRTRTSRDAKNRQVVKLSDPMRVLIRVRGEDSEESSKLSTHTYSRMIYDRCRFDRVFLIKISIPFLFFFFDSNQEIYLGSRTLQA